MIDSTASTFHLLLLLGSRERRKEHHEASHRWAGHRPEQWSDSVDDGIVVDVAEELARRIDEARTP